MYLVCILTYTLLENRFLSQTNTEESNKCLSPMITVKWENALSSHHWKQGGRCSHIFVANFEQIFAFSYCIKIQ